MNAEFRHSWHASRVARGGAAAPAALWARLIGLLSAERIVAPDDFNRWRAPPVSVVIHLCIGSLYAWSIFNAPLTRVDGVVTSSGNDWGLSSVVWIFTVTIVSLGLCAAITGRWIDRAGPRMVGVASACLFGGGFIVGGLGIWTHQLWLLYLGYGAIGGCGLGLAYVSPVAALLRWFPDRRGLATGMAIMGFGGGAIIAAPLKEGLIRFFYRAPQFLGSVADVDLVTRGGRRFAEVSGAMREVVVVSANDVQSMIVPGVEGVYVAGTGDVGIMWAFVVLGVFYFTVMMAAAFAFRVPAPGWQPPGWEPPEENEAARRMIADNNLTAQEAVRTRQFYLIWIMLCLNVTAGIGVLAVAKTMITEIFGSSLPGVVDSGFAATYVVMISVFNMGGRLAWSAASDYLGRKLSYTVFFAMGVVLYASIPVVAWQTSVSPSIFWLVCFYGATMLIFTAYGGAFATIPAYLADIFGTRFVASIHGRLLTAWSMAGVVGPLAITSLRRNSEVTALRDLAGKADPAAFFDRFGAHVAEIDLLIQQKTVTVSKLMDIVPAGTPNPSAGLYSTTMFVMAALLVIAFVANLFMGPVRHTPSEDDEAASAAARPDPGSGAV